MFNGMEPDKVVYDQSKMRSHLIQCFEKQQLDPFPVNRQIENVRKSSTTINAKSDWKMPRRSARLSGKRKDDEKNIASPNRFSSLSDENPTNIETEENNNRPQTPVSRSSRECENRNYFIFINHRQFVKESSNYI